MDPDYSLTFWQPIVQHVLASDAPAVATRPGALPFSMKWLELESAGNPCAIGRIDQLSADGSNPYPREIGIGQAYNPDDLRAQGIDPAALRAYCQPPAVMADLAKQYAAAVAAKDTQTMHQVMVKAQSRTRMLTTTEVDQQVRATLTRKIIAGVGIADATVKRYALDWIPADVWKLAKCDHALPEILNRGMPAVVAQLKRAPHDWREFRIVLGMDHDPKWNNALNACEACGNATLPSQQPGGVA